MEKRKKKKSVWTKNKNVMEMHVLKNHYYRNDISHRLESTFHIGSQPMSLRLMLYVHNVSHQVLTRCDLGFSTTGYQMTDVTTVSKLKISFSTSVKIKPPMGKPCFSQQ